MNEKTPPNKTNPKKNDVDTLARRSQCPISYALDIFGDKWTLLVLRDLIIWKKSTFQELKNSSEGIATNILADRLRRLEAFEIITREPDPDDGRRIHYRVTERGTDLVPALLEIGAWGARNDIHSTFPQENLDALARDRDGVIAQVKAGVGKKET